MKIKAITSDRTGHIVLSYSGGEQLSILWDAMSHTDNYLIIDYTDPYVCPPSFEKLSQQPWSSTTVELMGYGKTIEKIIKDKGWDNPTWMILLEDLLDLLIELRSR